MRFPRPTDPEGIHFRGTDIELDMVAELMVSETESVPLRARLTYGLEQPFGVLLQLLALSDLIAPWWFGRDLLYAGLQAPSGEGDVQIKPWHRGGQSFIRITLFGSDASAALDLPREPVRKWMAETLDAIPLGTEAELICWDRVVDMLMSDG